MADASGSHFEETLTGFKWLCRPGLAHPDWHQVLLYEEALGYAIGPGCRDKDGITAALVVADLVAGLRAAGRTVGDVLDDLARAFGAHVTANGSVAVEGPGWQDRLAGLVDRLVAARPSHLGGTEVVADDRPAPDVLRLWLADDTRVVVRPSGTEPKLKYYCEAVEAVGDDGVDAARDRARGRLAPGGRLRDRAGDLTGPGGTARPQSNSARMAAVADSPRRSAPASTMAQRVAEGPDPARGLHPGTPTDGVTHGPDRVRGGPSRRVVAGGGLHEVGPGVDHGLTQHPQRGRRPQGGLQDHLQHHARHRGPDLGHVGGDGRQVPLGRGGEVGHHVHLRRALGHHRGGLAGLGAGQRRPVGEPDHGADRQAVAHHLHHEADHGRLHAHRGAPQGHRFGRHQLHVGPGGLGTQDGVVDPGREPGAVMSSRSVMPPHRPRPAARRSRA